MLNDELVIAETQDVAIRRMTLERASNARIGGMILWSGRWRQATDEGRDQSQEMLMSPDAG